MLYRVCGCSSRTPNFRHHSGRNRIPKSAKCLRMPRRLMNPMSSRKLSPTLSSEYCVCRKLSFQTTEPLPAIYTRGRRLRQKSVEAERLEEAEIRVDAGDLVAIGRRPGGLPREKDRADVRVAQDVAPSAQHGVVVAVAAADRL